MHLLYKSVEGSSHAICVPCDLSIEGTVGPQFDTLIRDGSWMVEGNSIHYGTTLGRRMVSLL